MKMNLSLLLFAILPAFGLAQDASNSIPAPVPTPTEVGLPAVVAQPVTLNAQTAGEVPQFTSSEFDDFIRANSSRFIVKHDKFKKITKITLDNNFSVEQLPLKDSKGSPTGIRFNLICAIPDKGSEDGDQPEIRLIFVSTSDDWRWKTCKTFAWLVDDAAMPWTDEQYDSKAMKDKVMEFHFVILNMAQFDKVCRAKTIDCKACNDEFSLNPKHFWSMQYVDQKLHAILKAQLSQ